VKVLRFGLPKAFRVFFGTFPLFFGYSLAGTIWFGDTSYAFIDVSQSVVTLFCTMHSDDLRKNFNLIFSGDLFRKIWSRLYLFTFQFIIVTVVLNIFLVVIQDTYLDLGVDFKSKIEEFKNEEKPKSDLEEYEGEVAVPYEIDENFLYQKHHESTTKDVEKLVNVIKSKIKSAQGNKITNEQEILLERLKSNCFDLIKV
jgi:hypothetical protein